MSEDNLIPTNDQETIYPALPLRDVVVYPHMVIPLFVGRDKSIQALGHEQQQADIAGGAEKCRRR